MSQFPSRKNIFITGYPGTGKTTLIQRLANNFREYHPVGFFTREIRLAGKRTGFELVDISGNQKGILAHVNLKTPQRVGKYGVDISGFETFLDRLSLEISDSPLVFIDEIGKMECFSTKFKHQLSVLLNSGKIVVATIARKGDSFIESLKQRPDIHLLELNLQNRDELVISLEKEIRGLLRKGSQNHPEV